MPKSIAHSSVIADALANKFIDGQPFYRQAKRYQAEKVVLSRQTMSGWVTQLKSPLTPLMKLLKQSLYEGPVLHLDETRFQVLGEAHRENTEQSYMYVYKGGPPDKPVVWYNYEDNKGSQVPLDFLFPEGEVVPESPAMFLVSDDYAGFNALAGHPGIIGHAACWAHTRRKYHEASQGRKKHAAAFQMPLVVDERHGVGGMQDAILVHQVVTTPAEQHADRGRALGQAGAVTVLIGANEDGNRHFVGVVCGDAQVSVEDDIVAVIDQLLQRQAHIGIQGRAVTTTEREVLGITLTLGGEHG